MPFDVTISLTENGTRIEAMHVSGLDESESRELYGKCHAHLEACIDEHQRRQPVPYDELVALLEKSRRSHYHCDDSWYCCALCDCADHGPLDSHDGEAARVEGQCNCGALAWNETVDDVLRRLRQAA